jgi:hypothetical protein
LCFLILLVFLLSVMYTCWCPLILRILRLSLKCNYILENKVGLLIFLSENTLVVNTYFYITEFTPTIEFISIMKLLLAVSRLFAVMQAVKTAVPTVCIKFCKFHVWFSENLKYYITRKNYLYRLFKKCRSNYFYGTYSSYCGLVKANVKCDKINWHESIDNNLWANPINFWKKCVFFQEKRQKSHWTWD